MELTELDFNQLLFDFGPFENEANFSADANFTGNGLLGTEENFAINGAFHITEMNRDVALRILQIIDPENQNPGVIETRKIMERKVLGLIDLSYSPQRFSFELKHGSFYPRLFMDQPFYADFLPLARIPMPVEYGRIPVKSLFKSLMEVK
jgi:hypothetical protein